MFTKAIVRPPGASYARALTTQDLGRPNYARAVKQHEAYCEALERCGLRLTRLKADERFPDSTFVEDTAVMMRALPHQQASAEATTSRRAILTRPGASSRAGEVKNIAEVLSRFCPELHSIQEPGTLDGGDVCEAEDHLFIGVSERTNNAGARQLAKLVASYGYTSNLVDIRGVKSVLHLKSGLAYLGNNRLAVIDELADHKAFCRYHLVRVNVREQYAANCVRVNDHVLVAAGFPKFEEALQDLGYKTLLVEMTEFQKMDGGLSCLSLRF